MNDTSAAEQGRPIQPGSPGHLEARVAEVVERERELGRTVTVVAAGHDKASTIGAFKQALHLPDWFGGNLDALYDCLSDEQLTPADTGRGERGMTIVWTGVGALEAHDPRAATSIRHVLDDATARRPDLHVQVIE